jgi:outer membrane murein-binding lipoprotein Lpp
VNKKMIQGTLAVFGLLIAGCLAYLYVLIQEAGDRWPMENEPGSLTSQIGTLRASIDKLRQQTAQIPARQEVLAAITVDYELAQTVLPRESSPDQLIAAIRTKAQQAGITPVRLQPSIIQAGGRGTARGGNAQGAGGAFETWRFTLNITGNYDQIASFVNIMEEFESPDAERTGSERRFFELLDINIQAQENGLANLGGEVDANSPVAHSCTLIMQTYRYTGQ